jgi:hypothetical protein
VAARKASKAKKPPLSGRRVSQAEAVDRLVRLGTKLWLFADEELEPIGTALVALSEALKYGEMGDRRIVRLLSEANAFAESHSITTTGRTPARLPQTSLTDRYREAVSDVQAVLDYAGSGSYLQPARLQLPAPPQITPANVLAWTAGVHVRQLVLAMKGDLDPEEWLRLLLASEPAKHSATEIVDLGLEAGAPLAARRRLIESVDRARRSRAKPHK